MALPARPDRHVVVVTLLVNAVAGVVFWAVVLGARAADVDHFTILSDPLEQTGGPLYQGAFSQSVVLVWMVGAVAAAFSGWVHRDPLLRDLGLLTGYLALDDMFLLHERAYKQVLPERIVYPLYALVIVLVLMRHARLLVQCRWALLLAASLLLLTSATVLDLLSPVLSVPHRGLLEESLEAPGIVAWNAFLVQLARDRVLACGAARPCEGRGRSASPP